MPDSGNEAQLRIVMDQVAEAAVTNLMMKMKVQQLDSSPREAPLPPLIKWLVGAIAGFGAAAIVGLGFWLVSSVSQMQVTLARLDERIANGSIKDARFDEIDRRVSKNEALISQLKDGK